MKIEKNGSRAKFEKELQKSLSLLMKSNCIWGRKMSNIFVQFVSDFLLIIYQKQSLSRRNARGFWYPSQKEQTLGWEFRESSDCSVLYQLLRDWFYVKHDKNLSIWFQATSGNSSRQLTLLSVNPKSERVLKKIDGVSDSQGANVLGNEAIKNSYNKKYSLGR